MSQQPTQPVVPGTAGGAGPDGPGAAGAGADDAAQQRVVVVTQDGMGVAQHAEDDEEGTNPADLVEHPAKVMRIGSMVKQLLEEVRSAPLDERGREIGRAHV